ncbi:hypothetical protein [Ochrobactrum teleogrylli]|uniref:Transcriptional regulator n=2 Tax=Ochrobactrum teleogrylli TaxID=2479765 RepID=A0ABY2Y2R0_9HYPH|nr:hypothetical protein [[Ochrobactrum] teleogrylli]TNV14189.1 hypothetical protein FIC94_14250 [[Ochrobactrum] teleogrylli]
MEFDRESYFRMKNPIRNVVVEYKNRRARKSGNSLWGNLDLKSIAREVDEDVKAPLAAEPSKPAIPQTGSKPAETIQEPAPQGKSIVEPVILEAIAPQQETETLPAIAAPASATPERKKRNTRRHLKPIADKPVKAKPSPRAKLDILDELQALEAENAALKRQLAEKLAAENQKMRKMLHRIETQIEP